MIKFQFLTNYNFKKFIPKFIKNYIKLILNKTNLVIIKISKNSKILSSFYYFLFNRNFDREHLAVLEGRLAYLEQVINTQKSSFLLRRNIHRIEKGLVMRPQKNIFGEDYILETIKIFKNISDIKAFDKNEYLWVKDVLIKYFEVVGSSKIVDKSRNLFYSNLNETRYINSSKKIPYSYDKLSKNKISFNDLKILFKNRKSVRWYKNKIVPLNLIKKAINIASFAPSACNRQPYNFYISRNKSQAVEIAECAGGTPGWAKNIPCIIVIVGDLSAYPHERDRHLIYIDGSLVSMQLMLAFETIGLSSCPINWPDIDLSERKLKKILNIKPYERPIMLISVGYADIRGKVAFSQKKNELNLLRKV